MNSTAYDHIIVHTSNIFRVDRHFETNKFRALKDNRNIMFSKTPLPFKDRQNVQYRKGTDMLW